MKIDCGPTYEERCSIKEKWHKWFALIPVRVASHDCRWLETVERKGTFHCCFDIWWSWEYRAIDTPKYLGGK